MHEDGKGRSPVLDRREFLRIAAAAGALGALEASGSPALAKALVRADPLTKVVWVSPRGTLEVMDDFDLWVPIKLGYFRQLGLNVVLEPGPTEATAVTKLVAVHQADVGYPSPGVLATSIDAGMPIIGVFEMFGGQVFDFAVPVDSPITSPKQLAGKTIAVGSIGWKVIIDPMLIELGINPHSVKYVEAGQEWGQVVALHKADAALCWEGLRAQWLAEGLKLRFFVGQGWSRFPSNCYAARKADLADPARREVLVRFLRGVVMGLEFAKTNPRAAAQITYRQFPDLAKEMTPQLALNSMRELQVGYDATAASGHGYGWFNLKNWQAYLNVLTKLGQLKKAYAVGEVVTNELIAAANQADKAKARRDAEAFRLDPDFAKTRVELRV